MMVVLDVAKFKEMAVIFAPLVLAVASDPVVHQKAKVAATDVARAVRSVSDLGRTTSAAWREASRASMSVGLRLA